MKTENVSNSVLSVSGTVLGGMASRLVADKIPVSNTKLKHGAIAAIAIVGASMLDRKDPTKAFAQDVAIGIGATQIATLVKEVVAPTDGMLKTALGNPGKFLANPSYNVMPMGRVRNRTAMQLKTHSSPVRFKAS